MQIHIEEYKGQKIWVDENGQFWLGDKDSKHSYNPGTSIRDIKEDLDFRDAYEKAIPVKVLRIDFPYLQVWNIRKVTSRRNGYERERWYTKDDSHYGPNHHKYPQEFGMGVKIIAYDEAIHKECERRFKEIENNNAWFRKIMDSMGIET